MSSSACWRLVSVTGLAAEHPRNLAHPVVLDQGGDRRRRAPVLLALHDAKVLVGVSRDLRADA